MCGSSRRMGGWRESWTVLTRTWMDAWSSRRELIEQHNSEMAEQSAHGMRGPSPEDIRPRGLSFALQGPLLRGNGGRSNR